MSNTILRCVRVLLILLCCSFSKAWAALDTTASTDDHSVNVPTGWWTYTNVTAAQVSSYLSANSARLTDIEVYSVVSGVPRFSVRMVRNSGAYSVPGWWWYYNQTASGIASLLSTNNARLIEIEPYDSGGGVIRFAVVMVSNTGAASRDWSWLYGVSSSQISSHISSSGHRLIDLDSYTEGGVKKYAVALVNNTGSDSKSWQWWLNQSVSGIASKVSSFNGRVVKIDRQADGTYNFIQVSNAGTNASAWWRYYGFSSLSALINHANQLAARPIDITTYVTPDGSRRYDAVFIDNANASTRRMRNVFGATFLDSNGNPTRGIFEAHLKQVGGSVKVNLNDTRRAETASALKVLHLLHSMRRVAAGTDTLNSDFVFYEYDPGRGKDACPDPKKETAANLRDYYNFETGLDQMMAVSDNRTTRGAVLRYGGFASFNATASAVGLTSTTLRHDIGCAYYNFATAKFDTSLRNDTSAADLARIYEGVYASTILSNTNSARTEFLESANPVVGANYGLQAIIDAEAALLNKSAIAASFGSLVRTYGKGGSYNTCLPDSVGGCGQRVIVRSGAGLIRLPIKVNGATSYRTYAFGGLISDTPVPCWENTDTTTVNCNADTNYTSAFSFAAIELFRDEIRSALQTW